MGAPQTVPSEPEVFILGEARLAACDAPAQTAPCWLAAAS
jgi:hypothetical protein